MPCGCRECGPYTIDAMGNHRTLTGEELAIPAPRPRASVREPLGARLERAWCGADRPAAHRAHAIAMGARRAASAPGGSGSFGSGGEGSATGPRRADGVVPVGVRPSAAEPVSIRLARIDKPTPPLPTPYGDLPVEVLAERVFGVAAPGGVATFRPPTASTVGPSDALHPLRQYVPPPPAPQEPCIINGFDPAWGTPPAEYEGVRLRFAPDLGAYEYDHALAMRGREGAWGEPLQLALIRRYYGTGFMLQPYKKPGRESAHDPWFFRWIVQRREVSCPEIG